MADAATTVMWHHEESHSVAALGSFIVAVLAHIIINLYGHG